jgi:hypothetical protein
MYNQQAALQDRQPTEQRSHNTEATTITTYYTNRNDNKRQRNSSMNIPLNSSTTTTSNPNKRNYVQSRITSEASIPTCNHHSWGDKLTNEQKEQTNIMRIAFRNIKYLPSTLPNSRHDELLYDINSSQIDIMGLAETNLCWSNIPTNENRNNASIKPSNPSK